MVRKPILWVIAITLIPLLGWWTYGLFDLDEGFYGAVVMEMNRRGEWITPFYNGKPWFEKPILLYWAAKPLVALFGPDFGARLPSVIASVLGALGVYAFAKRRMSPVVAVLAPTILATSLLWVALGRMMMTDTLLAVSFNLACLTFYESMVGDKRWRWATGALLGLGVLAKGPVSLLLFGPLLGWVIAREPELRKGLKGAWLGGFVLLFAVIASWYLPAYLKDGEMFVQKFLIEQNLNRFTGGDTAHSIGGIANLLFFLPVLLLGMAPWSFRVFAAWPRRATSDPLNRYLAACAAIPFIFFTISGTKLIHYVQPCLIPLSLLFADHLSWRWSADGRTMPKARWIKLAAGVVFMSVFANVGFHTWYRLSGHAEVHAMARLFLAKGGENVAAYQMPRRQADQGTGKPKLQETSHPSLAFMLNRVFVEAETIDELEAAPKPLYVITRAGRIKPGEAPGNMSRIAESERGNYELWIVE